MSTDRGSFAPHVACRCQQCADHTEAEVTIGSLMAQVVELRRENERLKERRFPIMGGPSIPWRLIEPHDRQARLNHGGQSLARLAERGGLGTAEALAVLEDRPWRAMDAGIAHDLLSAYAGWVAPDIHQLAISERDGARAEANAARRERDQLRIERGECVLTVHAQRMIDAEREACAKVADAFTDSAGCHDIVADWVAAAIRARGGG